VKKRPLGRSIEPTIQNGVGRPAIMVKGIGRIGSALCVLILLSPHGISETGTWDDPPQLIFDQEQGLLIDSSLNISGTYIDEEAPTIFRWKIYDGTDVIANVNGDLLESLVLSGGVHESSRNSWEFSLDLNFSFRTHCACVLEIEIEDTSGQYVVAQLMFFQDAENFSYPPRIVLENPPEIIRGTVVLQPIARDADGFVGSQWTITNNSDMEILCSFHYPPTLPSPLHWSSVDNNATVTIDSTNYEDGDYFLLVRAVRVNGDLSPSSCHRIGIDNNPPTASIDGPTHSDEFSGEIQFDGSGSSDQFLGQEGLIYLWVLEDEFGENLYYHSAKNFRTFSVDASQAGNYTLTLTVADDAGFSDTVSHQFNITNQEPVAALRIGGQALEDGDSITLTDSPQWLLECGDSTDTDNDQSGLVCTWYIDEEPMMTGWSRQLHCPDDLSTPHTLMLEVTDDNGDSDTITVQFGVRDTPSDPTYVADDGMGFLSIIGIVVAITLALLAVLVAIRQYSGGSTSIPKWKRE
jgi:hypothetical protein